MALLVGFLVFPVFLPQRVIEFIDGAGIVLGYLLSGFAAAAALLSIPYWRDLSRWVKAQSRSFYGVGENAFPMRGKIEAIVIPVSRYEQPAWIIRHLQPKEVALLYTETSKSVAVRLADEFGTRAVFRPMREEIARTEMRLDEPYDPLAARALTAAFLRRWKERGISPQGTFVDTTGGTAPMSIGAFLAAEEAGVSSIYVLGTAAKDEGGEAIFIADPADPSHGEPRYLSDHTRDR
ncbi:MAG TPA: hypothetical protein VLF66_16980 [Thermoanaerobaculia bacterium]|nr:hypothetical protein [Thermoanaerobaculia bacterium]